MLTLLQTSIRGIFPNLRQNASPPHPILCNKWTAPKSKGWRSKKMHFAITSLTLRMVQLRNFRNCTWRQLSVPFQLFPWEFSPLLPPYPLLFPSWEVFKVNMQSLKSLTENPHFEPIRSIGSAVFVWGKIYFNGGVNVKSFYTFFLYLTTTTWNPELPPLSWSSFNLIPFLSPFLSSDIAFPLVNFFLFFTKILSVQQFTIWQT